MARKTLSALEAARAGTLNPAVMARTAPQKPEASMLRMFPLLLIVVVAYNVFFLVTDLQTATAIFSLTMPSGVVWTLSLGSFLLMVGLVLLYLEILKSTRTTSASVADHAMSMVLFVVCLLEFILVPRFATDTFFLIMLMTAVDVVAGFSVTITAARRDFGFDQ